MTWTITYCGFQNPPPQEDILEWKEKDKYTAEELQSTMNSIKTRLIILCEMRGL